MTQQKPNPFGWFVHGPLGPWGGKLGFRWAFPIGTMPVPFHPLFFPLAMLGIVGWALYRIVALTAGATSGGDWMLLLAIALALGVGLSIPILAWALVALGGRLIQASLILCAMVLLATGSLAGANPLWLVVVPSAFFAIWLIQMIGGRVLRRRLIARWRDFVPSDPDGRPIAISNNFTWTTPSDLLHRNAVAELWREDYSVAGTGSGHFRIDQSAARRLRDIAGEAMPSDWALTDHDGVALLERSGPIPANAVRLAREDWQAPLRMLAPQLRRITLDGGQPRSVIYGSLQPVVPVPLFEAFHWTSLTGPGQWRVGFAYGQATRIGPPDDHFTGLLTLPDLVEHPRQPRTPATRFSSSLPTEPVIGPARLDELAMELAADVARRQSAVAAFRAAVTDDPMGFNPHHKTLNLLQQRGPAPLGSDAGEFLFGWLERGRDARKRDAVRCAGGLISKLSDEAFSALAPALHDTLNSRMLALEWKLVPGFDPAPLPKDTPRFGDRGGFGLAFKVPQLWIRLGDINPPSRHLVERLAEEMPLPPKLMQALERWRAEAAG